MSRLPTAVVAFVAMAGLAACAQETGTTSEQDAPDPTSSSAGAADPVALTADASSAGKCAMPNAETLAGFDTAFEGTVTSLADGTATLAVDQWYAGGDGADTVTVTTPSEQLSDLLSAVEFEADQTYLVSATDGRVTLCGFTAEKSAELEGLYQAAFAG